MSGLMRSYIERLRQQAEDVQRASRAEAEARRHPPIKGVLCNIPLTEQIESLMRTLPPAQRDRAWSMDDLVARLNGRYRVRPHPKNVGDALRQLGWTRQRDWTAEGGGRRVWSRSQLLVGPG